MPRVRIPFQALALFTRQLVTLLHGGVPLVRALEAVSLQSEYPAFGKVIEEITRRVESGHRFSDSLTRYPELFPKIYVVMVEIGEHSGGLHQSMESLAGWLERDGQLRQRIRSALTYPAFILSLAGVLTLAIFYWVMPAFLGIFSEMQVELPLITRITLGLTSALRSPSAWLATALILAGLTRQLKRTWEDQNGRLFLYSLALRVPLLGGILWNGSTSRYCSAVETLLNSGSTLERSLRLSAAVSGSPVLLADAPRLTSAVMEGHLASDHMLEHPDIYSLTMAHMAAAGEEASRFPEMFGRAGDFHAMEMEGQVETLKAALEPILLAGVALVVGTIILSVFLPLYGFLNKLS